MSDGGSEVDSSSGKTDWDPSANGTTQLRELNAMARDRGKGLLVSTALFVTANAVLVASFFQQEEHYLARTAIALLGLLTAVVWFIIAYRSVRSQTRLESKAAALERRVGVASEFRIWDDEPKGFLNQYLILGGADVFFVFWVVGLGFAAYNLLM